MQFEFFDLAEFEENLNDTFSNSCQRWQAFDSIQNFFTCYTEFLKMNLPLAIFELCLIVCIVLFNLIVIFQTLRFSNKSLNIHDRILMSYCFTNLLTGLFELPFFHLECRFNYWPLGPNFGMFTAAFSALIKSVINLQMLYMSYIRYRSLEAPASYTEEFLARKSLIINALIWIAGSLIWFTCSFYFKTYLFTTHINYDPHFYQTILLFFSWTLPLILVVYFSAYIIIKLFKRNKTMQKQLLNGSGSSSLSKDMVQLSKYMRVNRKFFLITAIYVIQSGSPSFFMLIEPYIEFHTENLILAFKYSTFTVCFTDALVILLFDSKIRLFSNRRIMDRTVMTMSLTHDKPIQ
jgi:hypothetical protein